MSGFTPKGHFDFLIWHDAATKAVLGGAGVILTAGGVTAASRRIASERARADEAERAAARAAGALRSIVGEIHEDLQAIVNELGWYSNHRVNLFLERDGVFLLVGRWSKNPNYARCAGPGWYPIDFGVLGRAWDGGNAEVASLPDPGTGADPSAGWVQRQGRMKVPADIAREMTMRSRSYAALRIASDAQQLGVLVTESTEPMGTSLSTIGPLDDHAVRLLRLLGYVRAIETDLLQAAVQSCIGARGTGS